MTTTSFTLIIFSFQLFLLFNPSLSTRSHCTNFICGDVEITYPFWLETEVVSDFQFCGYKGFGINCSLSSNPRTYHLPIIQLLSGNNAYIKKIDYTNQIVELIDVIDKSIVFQMHWNTTDQACVQCEASNGLCGFDYLTDGILCWCKDETLTLNHCGGGSSNSKPNVTVKININVTIYVGVIVATGSTASLITLTIRCNRRRREGENLKRDKLGIAISAGFDVTGICAVAYGCAKQ